MIPCTNHIEASITDHHRILGCDSLVLQDMLQQFRLVTKRSVKITPKHDIKVSIQPEVLDNPF